MGCEELGGGGSRCAFKCVNVCVCVCVWAGGGGCEYWRVQLGRQN